jgi:hypothetical protein
MAWYRGWAPGGILEMKQDKQQTSFNDILDSPILDLSEYQLENARRELSFQ